jgi:hypothetical protein
MESRMNAAISRQNNRVSRKDQMVSPASGNPKQEKDRDQAFTRQISSEMDERHGVRL